MPWGSSTGMRPIGRRVTMTADRNSMEFTVMTYAGYIGASTTGGYVNETFGYAQSLMMYDIAALQFAYGANYTTRAGNTTYTFIRPPARCRSTASARARPERTGSS